MATTNPPQQVSDAGLAQTVATDVALLGLLVERMQTLILEIRALRYDYCERTGRPYLPPDPSILNVAGATEPIA